MSFLVQAPKRVIERTPIVLVNTCPSADAIKALKPLDTKEQSVLEQSLHMAGLTNSEVTVINLFPESVTTAPFWQDSNQARRRMFKAAATPWIERLKEQLLELNPKVVVPLGEIPIRAVLNRWDWTSIRGYPFQHSDGFMVIPSLRPKDMIWTNYVWRFYLSNDLKRAKDFSDGLAKVVHPNLRIVLSLSDALGYLESFRIRGFPIAFDIEVSNFETSCIGFSQDLDEGITIPFDDRWSEIEEVKLWNGVARLLEDPTLPKITQNGLFDTYFLAYKNGIFTRGTVHDTMIAHSLAFPDFLKGLGFLGSVHTWYTYWKDQADHKSIKQED